MKIYYIGNQVTVLILLCAHGWKIIPRDIFEKPKIASINVHPYLYCYKGADPVGRAIKDHNQKASVGCHYITETVDLGEVVKEMFVNVQPTENRAEIYNQLYETYSKVIKESLNLLEQSYIDNLEEPNILVGGIGY